MPHEQARRQHRAGEPRQGDVQAFIHLCELRHHVTEQEQQRAADHQQQDGRVDQRIDHARLEFLAAFQIVGQPLQGFMQAAAGFTGTHHVDVQAREQTVLALHRLRQRCAATHGITDVTDHPTRTRVFGCVQQDGQRTIQRLAGAEQGGQLLGELHQRGAGKRPLPPLLPARAFQCGTGGEFGLHRQMTLLLQARDDVGVAGRVHLPVQHFAMGIQCLVTVQRHQRSGSRCRRAVMHPP
ncbi:hypothetical protein D3C71_1385730 [compost metagenome]